MDQILNIQVKVDKRLYVNDPFNSDLGRKIIAEGTVQLNQIGVEKFTFRKLAKKTSCTEAAVYRYFENKYKLLNYIISWYYGWLEYHIVFTVNQKEEPSEKIDKLIELLTEPVETDPNVKDISNKDVHELVIRENIKVIHTVITDEELDKQGYSFAFNNIINRIQSLLEQLSCDPKTSRSLASFIFFQSQQMSFLSRHRKTLVNNDHEGFKKYIADMVKSKCNCT